MRAHWWFTSLSWISAAGLFLLGLSTTPDPRGHSTHEQLGLPPCGMIDLTGIPCPGCGVTTAMTCFAQGDFAAAAVAQPFGALLALGIVSAAAFATVETALRRDAWADVRRMSRPWMAWGAGLALLAAWAYKIAALRG